MIGIMDKSYRFYRNNLPFGEQHRLFAGYRVVRFDTNGGEMIKNNVILLVALVLMLAMPIMAGNYESKKATEALDYEGTLVCQACSLKKADGARAACSEYGHTHALKTKDDKFVSFLENQYSADLLKGEKYHNKKITVHGRYFANANVLDVEWFEVDGKKKAWCGHCESMDSCAKMDKK